MQQMPKINPLKLASLALAAIGFFVHSELQRRETEELVEKVLDKREAEKMLAADQ